MTGYITPAAFSLESTIDIILTGVVGRLTTAVGVVFGPIIAILFPEVLRFIQDVRLIVYGAFLIVLLVYLSEGIDGWIENRL